MNIEGEPRAYTGTQVPHHASVMEVKLNDEVIKWEVYNSVLWIPSEGEFRIAIWANGTDSESQTREKLRNIGDNAKFTVMFQEEDANFYLENAKLSETDIIGLSGGLQQEDFAFTGKYVPAVESRNNAWRKEETKKLAEWREKHNRGK